MNCFLPDGKEVTNLIDLIEYRSICQFDSLAYRFINENSGFEQTITYGELSQKAKVIAGELQTKTRVGDRVILIYPPGFDLIAAYFGCLYAGVVAVPVYPPFECKSG